MKITSRFYYIEYYQKNPSASQSLKGSLYEAKILELVKTKIKLNFVEIETTKAEKIISDFNKPNIDKNESIRTKSSDDIKQKPKKISKK